MMLRSACSAFFEKRTLALTALSSQPSSVLVLLLSALILLLLVWILLQLALILLMLGGLATSSSRATNLDLLLPPILSVGSYHLAYPLWYCDFQLAFLSGCAHRCYERDNGCRGQSDHHLAYHGAHSSYQDAHPSL